MSRPAAVLIMVREVYGCPQQAEVALSVDSPLQSEHPKLLNVTHITMT